MKQGSSKPRQTTEEVLCADRPNTSAPTKQQFDNSHQTPEEMLQADRPQICRDEPVAPKQLLDNPDQQPDEALLRSTMDARYIHFEALCALLDRLGASREWNYYKDGKHWLCKVQYRKKTVLWLSLWEGFLRLSFFFNQKSRGGVARLDIDPALRTSFLAQNASGKLYPFLLDIHTGEELTWAETLINYKIS